MKNRDGLGRQPLSFLSRFWHTSLLLLCVISAGCGGSQSTAAPGLGREPTVADVIAAERSEVIAETLAAELEYQDAMVGCMKADGWEYRAVDESAELEYASDFFRLVVEGEPDETGEPTLTVAEALEYGMENGMLFDDPELTAESEFNREYSSGLSIEAQVSYADSLDECFESSQRKVGADHLYTVIQEAEALKYDALTRVLAKSEIQRLLFDWDECIRRGGIENVPPNPADLREWLVQYSVGLLPSESTQAGSQDEVLTTEPEVLDAKLFREIFEFEELVTDLSEQCGGSSLEDRIDEMVKAEIDGAR